MQRLLSNPKIKGLLPAPDERRVTMRETWTKLDNGVVHRTEVQMADGSWRLLSVMWNCPPPPSVFYSSPDWKPWEPKA